MYNCLQANTYQIKQHKDNFYVCKIKLILNKVQLLSLVNKVDILHMT